MEAVAGAFAALSEALVFLNHFKDLSDPRQPGKVIYPLDEVLLLCLACGAGPSRDIRRYSPVRGKEARSSAAVSAVS
jgi:hypothetical protein